MHGTTIAMNNYYMTYGQRRFQEDAWHINKTEWRNETERRNGMEIKRGTE